MNMKLFYISGMLCLVSLTFLSLGCHRGMERVSIEGTVTYQGKPLDGGELTFMPEAGPGCGVDIASDGTYTVLKSYGPMPGNCRVVVKKNRNNHDERLRWKREYSTSSDSSKSVSGQTQNDQVGTWKKQDQFQS